MRFIEATNVVASRLPECQLTGTPTTRANFKHKIIINLSVASFIFKFPNLEGYSIDEYQLCIL